MNEFPSNLWYPLFLAREVVHQPRRFERFGVPWVVCRLEDGRLFMAQDRCPHLGASLSDGKIIGNRLECPFHGFCFEGDGRCTHIPALGLEGRIPEKLRLKTLPLREVQGWIWGWWGEKAADPDLIPLFAEFRQGWHWQDIASDWSVHVTRAIENQLDVAHLPFVHRKSIGAGGRTLVEGPYVEADQDSIRIWVTNRRDDGAPPRSLESLASAAKDLPPSIEFRFPGLWQLRIHPTLRLLVAFVPVHAGQTRFYVRACHQVRIPLLSGLYSRLLGLSNRWILREDQRVVTRILPASSLDADNDHLIAADRAIVQFRKLWRRHLETHSDELTS